MLFFIFRRLKMSDVWDIAMIALRQCPIDAIIAKGCREVPADLKNLLYLWTKRIMNDSMLRQEHAVELKKPGQNQLVNDHALLTLRGYTGLEPIGHGAQGTMLKALSPNGERVAIKCFDLRKISDWKEEELFRREIDTLKSIDVQGVPHFIETLESDSIIYLVEEFFDAPSLDRRLKDHKSYSFSDIEEIYKNIAKILYNLQNRPQPIIHRDLKPANILVADDLSVRLVDFGVVAAKNQQTSAMTFAGTAGYVAPEQLYGKVTPAADVFSLGATMLQLVSGRAPCDMEMNGLTPDFDRYIPLGSPHWLTQLIKDSLNPDPQKRVKDAAELLKRLQLKENYFRNPQPGFVGNNNFNNQNHYDRQNPHIDRVLPVRSRTTQPVPSECDKTVSLLLCLFMGVFGVHRFYEGKIVTGIIYACTAGLFGFGVCIDFLILLFKPKTYPRKRY